jgi:hypothetical protein
MLRSALLLLLILLAACTPAPEPPPAEVVLIPNRIIGFWQSAGDTLTMLNEVQRWQFVASEGDEIRLRISGQSAAVTLEVTAPDGTLIARGNDIRARLPADGIYTATLTLTQAEPSPYTLMLEYTDRGDPSKPTLTPSITPTVRSTATPTLTPTPTPVYADLGVFEGKLASGTGRDGAFSRTSEQHVYTFDGEAGQFVNIRMVRLSGRIDPVLWLYDPQGEPIASDDNSGGDHDALLRNIRLDEGGLYSIQSAGDGQTGEYRINFTSGTEREQVVPQIPQPTPTTIPTGTPMARADRLGDHQPVTGRIARAGDFVRYPIAAVQGEVFTLSVSPVTGSAVRPEVELYSPSGVLVQSATVFSSNANGSAIIPMFTAGESGTYVALVQAEGNGTGDFVIAYGLGASSDSLARGSVSANVPVVGEVVKRAVRDVWSISLSEGDVITITVNPQSATFDPVLELVAPDGARIAMDDNSGGGRTPLMSGIRAPQTGQYWLYVTGANAGSSGVYTLVWRYVIAAPTPTPSMASVMILSADTVAPPQQYVFYPFQGQATQRLLIRARAQNTAELDLVMALLDANGEVIAQADDNGTDLNPLLEFTLPADGTYTLRLNGYGESTGEFTLTVEALY